ncbi:MAG TPA: 5-formyltetrahydrofolate cyclo-ligase, partial [Solirubrobacterales bacterium]|nr:5-formyltetrahydrofolate cyclo-ligase [Solirubrobacterales bacterium]
GLSEIDLFVVPARAVDANGHRLGRGKGYYDATLAAASPKARRVCLVFDQQIVDLVPTEPHDARMDAICTDARWLDLPERTS